MDGPVYVERCALYDNKQRNRAKKAIRKALQLQVDRKGLSFVEILSECPTHLKLTPPETEQWVKENMVPVFPLGVKKDLESEPWFDLRSPSFEAREVVDAIGGTDETPQRFGTAFPAHIDAKDVAIKFAGAGGDGAQTIAMLTTRTAINEGWDSTHIPSYGPESRGGTSYADVHVATEEVLSPACPEPHILIAFNPPSLEKFAPTVRPGGTVIYDNSVITKLPKLDNGVRLVGVPCAQIATDLGKTMVKNVVALGALQAATQLFPKESFLSTLRQALKERCALLAINEEAFAWGARAYEESAGGK
jgi:2-oxoisovalerate ferredoxin oxidoreductase beta subunit